MKALFATDHRFIPSAGQVWSETQFDAALWPRYLAHFDSLTVVGRHGDIPNGKTTADLELSSAPSVTFETFPNLSSLRGQLLARPAAARRMRALVAAHDAVLARLPSELGLAAVAAAQRLGKPWAVEIAGCPWDGIWNYGGLAGKLYAPIAWARMRQAVGQADHALYVTREFLQDRYPTKAANTVSASNVVLTQISEAQLDARRDRIATIGTRPVRLGLIGTLRGRFKGIQTVLAALAQERDTLGPLHLHVLGGGDPAPWQAEAAQLGVADLVSFEGTLPAGEPVLRWLDEIDLYLQPSLKEGLPRALIEAMSRACPAIASRVAGIPELLPPEDLIRPGDARALAGLLRQRVTDQDWMRDRAQRNWDIAADYRGEILEEKRNVFWSQFATRAAKG